uniref:Uncharacterized protein n=1 Tax=Cacopsylla melanoneura TaxID=428564 RepID=A0A8D8ST05_9HEMI
MHDAITRYYQGRKGSSELFNNSIIFPMFFFCLIGRDRIPSLGGVGCSVCICDANIKKRCSARLPKSWNCNISYQTGFIGLRVAFFQYWLSTNTIPYQIC